MQNSSNLKQIKITTEFITLGQFLKFANIVNNGGESKLFIIENDIYVNEELEKRRGRKLYSHDKIKIGKVCFEII